VANLGSEPPDQFGPNDWLVDELYQQFQNDRSSVDPAWWDFFDGYTAKEQHAAVAPLTNVTASTPAPAAPAAPTTQTASSHTSETGDIERLKGAAARVVTNMEESLSVPTATSVRSLPVKLLFDNRVVINNHLARGRGGKVSFTHIIAYALVQALKSQPEMNYAYEELDGKPAIRLNTDINLGLAIDIAKPDGTRQLLVPNIKATQNMGFAAFWASYEDIVRRARSNSLTVEDFAGTTVSLTNPGTIGTNHSIPRLVKGQGAIIGVGSMEYPAQWQGASEESIVRNAVSKILTLTSTYDHRIIQGAQSGEFLRKMHMLILGEDNFYGEIFRDLRIPYVPIQWAVDISANHETDLDKNVRVQEIIHAFRVRGHLMADLDPLEYHQRMHPDLDVLSHGLTLWDLDREFATGGFGNEPLMKLRRILGVLRDSYTRTVGIE
jgi:2-oxoglutarate dehydrogenase E1 component